MTDDTAVESPETPTVEESFGGHLRQFDHWTFLLGFALVLVNIRVRSRELSIGAALLLFAAIVYDAYEFYAQE